MRVNNKDLKTQGTFWPTVKTLFLIYLLQTPESQFSDFRSKQIPFGKFSTNFSATWLEALENSFLSDMFYFIFAGDR